ncbi:GH25 family lysozyme [Bacillus thuringiensis]|uniref:GH25 family lysozyme n=1 Tax=Bacillus thuringiensis TaxID=1428 RepID=UPI000BF24EE3|nr:GH25 family lysozyme [Bacillus thuringiensis]PFN63944.1 N-acetylmuramoyl-L-alanine amidase [Bacillus thuringiensis]
MGKYIVDLSKWNDKMKWPVAAPQIELAICRVQYGSNLVDYLYSDHVANLEQYGIPHGAYAYGCFVSVTDAIVEAKDFMKRVSPNAKFLALDVEKDTVASMKSKGNLRDLAKASQAFVDTCKAEGWKVGFYVSHELYNQHNLQNVQADFLWIPRYGTNDGTPQKKPNYVCDIWQYTDNAHINGIGKVDINLLQGDKTLGWYIGEHHESLVPPSSSVAGKRVESKVNNLRFYSKPSWANRDVVGTVNKGLGFIIDEKVMVNGSTQYKVHNSKGATYYITASEKYVCVK